MSASTSSRKSKRIEDRDCLPKAKVPKTQISKRLQWKLDNESVLAAHFDLLIDALIKYGGEDNVREEGEHSFENWAEIVADELAPGVTRICNDDSTEDEDEVEGLGSGEDDEGDEEPEEEETDEDSQAPEYDESDEDEEEDDEDDEE